MRETVYDQLHQRRRERGRRTFLGVGTLWCMLETGGREVEREDDGVAHG
jgi:hypothetical protein